jgi:hypothetical protein
MTDFLWSIGRTSRRPAVDAQGVGRFDAFIPEADFGRE